MPYVPRAVGPEIERAARQFPALILTGPRRAGKTTLLRHLFPTASYVLLEDPDVIARVRSDPRGFLEELRLPVILDELQNAPELLGYIRARIDRATSAKGRWLLTGSQEAPLMRGVTESMAGRAAVLSLLPFSTMESPKVTPFRGGFPEALARAKGASLWLSSYVQTYLERDVRAVTSVRDLSTFRRFIGLVASRVGQVLNKTDLATPLGVSVPTVTAWLSVLEVTAQIVLVPPYFDSFGKRLVKSPKLYLLDSGLACHLLGIESEAEMRRSPFLGAIYEGFVASEIAKAQLATGRPRQLYYFRDQQGLEVDFVVPLSGNVLAFVEAKAGRTVRPSDGERISRLASAARDHTTRGFVVHPSSAGAAELSALRPGVRALPLDRLLSELFPPTRRGHSKG